MLTLSGAMNASAGSSYYKKDGYYAKGQSQWYGKGAEALGLSGDVSETDFDAILHGFDPKNRTRLVKNAGDPDRRSYWDGTFSAPKSVSVLLLADHRIEAAHNKAVAKAIQNWEKEYAYTRQASIATGAMETVKTGNLVMARFNHYASRSLDIDLHSHIVIANETQREDDKWGTLELKKFFQDRNYNGQIYRNELAKNMTELGYKIIITDSEQGFFEIAGVTQDLIDLVSKQQTKIKHQREKNDKKYTKDLKCDKNSPKYQKAFIYFQLKEAEKTAIAAKAVRKPKTKVRDEDIKANCRAEMEAYLGFTLEKLRNRAEAEKGTPAILTAEECIKNTLAEVTEKQSVFTEEDVIDRALRVTLGHYTADQLLNELHRLPNVEHIGNRGQFERSYYTTTEIREAEQAVINFANNGKGKSQIAITLEATRKRIEEIQQQFNQTAAQTGSEPIEISDQQKAIVEMICTTKDQLSLVQGDAGTGKTFTMDIVRKILNDEKITIRGFAPTATAATELVKAAKIEAMTIDKLFANDDIQAKIGQGEVWLVDEAGMVGSLKMAKLLEFAAQKDAKVVLIGDVKQFQPVDQGKIFADLQSKTTIARTEITKVKRQKTPQTVGVVEAIKALDFHSAFKILADNNGLKEIADKEARKKYIIEKYLDDPDKSVILTGINADRIEFNKRIRAVRAADGKVTGGGTFETFVKTDIGQLAKCFAGSYSAGQVVILKKDCDNIPRGTQAKVESVNTDTNTIKIRYKNKATAQYETADIDAKNSGAKYDVFNVVEKDFGVGDKVLFTKNDPGVKVANGQTGVIEEIGEDGTAKIKIGTEKNGTGIYIECNLTGRGSKGYTYLDHAYCLTNHKSQGASYDNVIVNADVSSQRTNYNAFYVQATRARLGILIVTDDKEKLISQAREKQDKPSTLDFLNVKYDDTFEKQLIQAQEAKQKTEQAAKQKTEQEAKRKAEEEDRQKVEREAKQKKAEQEDQERNNIIHEVQNPEYIKEIIKFTTDILCPSESPTIIVDKVYKDFAKEGYRLVGNQRLPVVAILQDCDHNIIAKITETTNSEGNKIYSIVDSNGKSKIYTCGVIGEDGQKITKDTNIEDENLIRACNTLLHLEIGNMMTRLNYEMRYEQTRGF